MFLVDYAVSAISDELCQISMDGICGCWRPVRQNHFYFSQTRFKPVQLNCCRVRPWEFGGIQIFWRMTWKSSEQLKKRDNKIESPFEICLYHWSICFCFPVCFCTLTFSEHMRPNEPSQFCSLFELGKAIKYSGLVLPWEQTGGCGCIIMPHPALLSTVHHEPSSWGCDLRRLQSHQTPCPIFFSSSLPSSGSSSHYLIAVHTYGYF